MTTESRANIAGRWAGALLVAGALAAPCAAQSTTTPQPAPAVKQAEPKGPAVDEFKSRLDAYLRLRSDLAKKLKPLSPTADAAELASRQESLAAALKQARKNAKRGDLVTDEAAAIIRRVVAKDLQQREPAARRATLQEVTTATPVINKNYPAQQALPTVPALLLNSLPVLPDNLQYRFYGRHVVILDGDTEIIIDYVPDVLPPH